MTLTPNPHLAALTFDEETHTYIYQGKEVPSVTGIIREAGMSSFAKPTGVTRPMEIGRWMHDMLRLHLLNKLDERLSSPGMEKVLNDFRVWARKVELKPLAVEVPLVHSAYRYAGKPDLIGTMYGTFTIFDWKWGDPRPSDLVQLAGYWGLANNCYDLSRYAHAHQIMPVYLKALGRGADPEPIRGHNFMEHHSMFQSAQMIYRWKERHRMLSTREEDGIEDGESEMS